MKGMKKLKGNDDPYSKEIRSKLKGTSSDKRKIAQKINSIPSMTPENQEKALKLLINSPSVSLLQLERAFDKVNLGVLERNKYLEDYRKALRDNRLEKEEKIITPRKGFLIARN